MNINSINKLTQHLYLITRTPSSKLMLLESLFRKVGHVANVAAFTPKGSVLLTGRCATAVGGRTIGQRCVEQEETPQLGIHHHHTDHKTDREGHRAASHSSSRAEEEGKAVASSSRKALPTSTRKEAPLPRRHIR